MEINTINNNIDNIDNLENNESNDNNDSSKTELKKCPICNKMVSNVKRHQKSKACSNFVKIIDNNNISNNNILNYIKLIEDEIISLEIDIEIKKNIQNNLNLITDNVKLLKNKSFSIIQNMCDLYNI